MMDQEIVVIKTAHDVKLVEGQAEEQDEIQKDTH